MNFEHFEGKHGKKPKQKQTATLTPEEREAALAAHVKKQAEEKAERQRLELFGKSVEKMSHRQLRGELVRTIKREHAGKPPIPQAGLTILYSTVLLALLENTQTKENPFAKLQAYPR